jgi:hypothetical protein
VVCNAAVELVGGPDEYLFGEEKALLEVIEGNTPLPRIVPPFDYDERYRLKRPDWTFEEDRPEHPGRPGVRNP